jgi:uncharacterized membrane protein YdbT with pleckstrin-like domain
MMLAICIIRAKGGIAMSKVQYSQNPAMFKSNPLGFILALILIPVFGIGLLILAWWYLQTRATLFEIRGNEILLETGLLSKKRVELALNRVRTVVVSQSFINRIFGVGTIEIYTAGDTPEMVVSGIPDPNHVREIIKFNEPAE